MKPQTNKSTRKRQPRSARFVEIKIDPAKRGKRSSSLPGFIEEMARLDWATCPVWNFTHGGQLTLAGWMN